MASVVNNSVFLYLGPEQGLKKEQIEKIKKQIAQRNGEEPELYRFYAADTDVQDLLSLMKNGSLFSSHKLVLLYGVEAYSRKADTAALAEFCQKGAEDATFIMISDEVKISASLQKAVAKDSVKIFWEMFENQKQQWIRQFFQSKGHRIEPDALDLILELVENKTDNLRVECSNLLFFIKDNEPVTHEIVESYIFHSREESVFTLFDSFCRRDAAGALEILRKILLSPGNEPVGLLAGLVWQIRRLLEAKVLFSRGVSREALFSKMNIRGKKNQKVHLEGLKNFSRDELEKALTLCADTDAALRSGNRDMQEMLLQLFLFKSLSVEVLAK